MKPMARYWIYDILTYTRLFRLCPQENIIEGRSLDLRKNSGKRLSRHIQMRQFPKFYSMFIDPPESKVLIQFKETFIHGFEDDLSTFFFRYILNKAHDFSSMCGKPDKYIWWL